MKSLNPKVWRPDSPYYLPHLEAVMVSYGEIHKRPALRKRAMELGIRAELAIPDTVQVYLDNGAFSFLNQEGGIPVAEYEEFVREARPDWYPIPQDFIPSPSMSEAQKESCYLRTMESNRAYRHDGFTPVVHISPMLERYTEAILQDERLTAKRNIALGAIVPNLLRTPKALPYQEVLNALIHVREVFADKTLHVFGIGGTSTLHIAALLGMDSLDSSGWRNRAARGVIQLPGRGERSIANLGSWKGKSLSEEELVVLENCPCPACRMSGIEGLKKTKTEGFSNRATHNLWTLLEEARWIREQMAANTYLYHYQNHVQNSIYRPLIDQIVATRFQN